MRLFFKKKLLEDEEGVWNRKKKLLEDEEGVCDRLQAVKPVYNQF